MTAILILTISPGLVTFCSLPADLQNHLLMATRKAQEVKSCYYRIDIDTISKSTQSRSDRLSGSVRMMKPDMLFLQFGEGKESESQIVSGTKFARYQIDTKTMDEIANTDKIRDNIRMPGFWLNQLQAISFPALAWLHNSDVVCTALSHRLHAFPLSLRYNLKLQRNEDGLIVIEADTKANQKTMRALLILHGPDHEYAYRLSRIEHDTYSSPNFHRYSLYPMIVNPINIRQTDFRFIPPPNDWTIKRREQ